MFAGYEIIVTAVVAVSEALNASVNCEFEWLLERISGKENIFKNDENTRYYFYNFLFDYQ